MQKVIALTAQTSSREGCGERSSSFARALAAYLKTWYFLHIFNKDIDYLVELGRVCAHVTTHTV